MTNFSEWFIQFFEDFLGDVWGVIKGFFIAVYNLFIGYPIKYFKDFGLKSASFGFLDWLFSIMFIMIFIVVMLLLIVVIYQFIRRYIHFTKIETEKMELLNRVNVLEKNRRSLGDVREKPLLPDQAFKPKTSITKTPDVKQKINRFARLTYIDEKYKFSILPTFMQEQDKLSLSQLVSHFRNFAASELGLYYNEQIIATFFAGLATSKLMILEGISGTGKTSLPYAFGKFINNNSTIVSVQPSWRDRFEMMGYLNEFTKRFNETEFLTALYEASYRTDVNLIVLDEMNLARVEYYFADFLSILELPSSDEWLLDIIPEQIQGDPIHLKHGQFKIPENVWFIGTANRDDSTFTITDKVYDRASSLEMNRKAEFFQAPKTKPISLSYKYLNDLFKDAKEKHYISEHTMTALAKLDDFIIEKFEITFGNRIMKQFVTFIPVYLSCGRDEVEGIDYLISRKILRKFETLNLPFLRKELEELNILFDDLFGKDKLRDSKEMINKYINRM